MKLRPPISSVGALRSRRRRLPETAACFLLAIVSAAFFTADNRSDARAAIQPNPGLEKLWETYPLAPRAEPAGPPQDARVAPTSPAASSDTTNPAGGRGSPAPQRAVDVSPDRGRRGVERSPRADDAGVLGLANAALLGIVLAAALGVITLLLALQRSPASLRAQLSTHLRLHPTLGSAQAVSATHGGKAATRRAATGNRRGSRPDVGPTRFVAATGAVARRSFVAATDIPRRTSVLLRLVLERLSQSLQRAARGGRVGMSVGAAATKSIANRNRVRRRHSSHVAGRTGLGDRIAGYARAPRGWFAAATLISRYAPAYIAARQVTRREVGLYFAGLLLVFAVAVVVIFLLSSLSGDPTSASFASGERPRTIGVA